MSEYNINKCFGIRGHINSGVNKPVAALAGFALMHTDELLKNIHGIDVKTFQLNYDDVSIDVHVITPQGYDNKLPCILDIHGGGFVFDGAPHHYELAARYARETGSVVVFPRYRLTPRNNYPCQLKDCFATYDWIKNNADLLNIDLNRIAVMGDSAGGYLAAMTVNYAVSKGDILQYQLLIYPVTDPTMSTESMAKYVDTPVWNAKNNKSMWNMYFRKQNVSRESQSLLFMNIPENIPPTYVETAEFDCLHDEGIIYAERLKNMGVSVSIYETKETMHGFDEIKCSITEDAIQHRIEFIRNRANGLILL